MQYNLQQSGKNNWTNLIVETEEVIRQLEVKMQDANRILAAKILKQLHYAFNNINTIQKTNVCSKKHSQQDQTKQCHNHRSRKKEKP